MTRAVGKLIKFCVHQAAKNKIDAPQDLILISAVSGGTTKTLVLVNSLFSLKVISQFVLTCKPFDNLKLKLYI